VVEPLEDPFNDHLEEASRLIVAHGSLERYNHLKRCPLTRAADAILRARGNREGSPLRPGVIQRERLTRLTRPDPSRDIPVSPEDEVADRLVVVDIGGGERILVRLPGSRES